MPREGGREGGREPPQGQLTQGFHFAREDDFDHIAVHPDVDEPEPGCHAHEVNNADRHDAPPGPLTWASTAVKIKSGARGGGMQSGCLVSHRNSVSKGLGQLN